MALTSVSLAVLLAAAALVSAAPPATSWTPSGPPPADGCWPVPTQYGVACACTAEYCDYPAPVPPLAAGQVAWYASARDDTRKRLALQPLAQLSPTPPAGPAPAFAIALDASQQFQTILGFGGALTDAAAINFGAMDAGVQQQIVDSYYSADGIGYTFARTHMGSCDFSTHQYSYADTPGDFNLTTFSVAMDEASGKLPLIRRVRAAVRAAAPGADLRLFATAWSPPAWAKTNGNMTGGSLLGTAGDAYHQMWALYFSKFVSAYEAAGVPVWGLTPGNEPLGAVWWDSCSWTQAQERDFIAADLGPRLRADHPTVQLMLGDDQRETLPAFAQTVLSDARAAPFVDGIAFHWYSEVEDLFSHWDKLDATATAWPSRFLLATEACEGYLPVAFDRGPRVGEWERGMTYAHDVLGDLQHHASGWIDWNVVLDLEGGPNHAANWVDAPFICDTANATICFKNPMFYALGHFAKFLPAGAVRIGLSSTSTDPLAPPLEVTAFQTPAHQTVVVVLNRDPLFGRDFQLSTGGAAPQYLTGNIEAAAVHTYLWNT